jgi:hypothetical protein
MMDHTFFKLFLYNLVTFFYQIQVAPFSNFLDHHTSLSKMLIIKEVNFFSFRLRDFHALAILFQTHEH